MTTTHISTSRQKLLLARVAAKATIAALALAGSLAAVAPAAHAEPVPTGPGSGDLAAACYRMQQDYIDGVAEYKTAYAAGDQAGMDAAGVKLRGAEDGWGPAGCGAEYGDIGVNRIGPTGKPATDMDPVTPPVKSNPTTNPRPGTGTLPGTAPVKSAN
jgi:hypothetical protein